MATTITIQNLNAAFEQLRKTAVNLRPLLPAIAELIESDIKDNFDAGGRWAGSGEVNLLSGGTTKWQPLAPSTLPKTAKRGYRNILVSTGELRNSIEVRPQGNSIVISSNKEYAAIQNFGGKAGKNRSVNIPARPFLVVQAVVVEEIRDLIAENL